MAFFVLMLLYFLERFQRDTGDNSPYNSSLFRDSSSFHLLSFSLVLLAVFAWYIYASWYSTGTIFQHFSSILSPVDGEATSSVIETFRFVFLKLQEDFFIPSVNHLAVLFLSISLLAGFAKAPHTLRLIFTFLLIGILVYLFLFKDLLYGHDYYFSPVFLLLIPLYIYAAYMVESFIQDPKIKRYLYGFTLLLLLMNVQNAKMEMQYCYYGNTRHYREKAPFYKDSFLEFLLEKGVSMESKIISYPDPSMNNTLYLMRRKGWSSLGLERMDANFVTQLKTEGAQFLILSDTTYRQDSLLLPALQQRIGSFEGIDIYDLSYLKW